MNSRYRRLTATSAIAFALAMSSTHHVSAEVLITDVTRLLFTTDRGNLVFRGEGGFDDSLNDSYGHAAQQTSVDPAGFVGSLTATLETGSAAEDKQAVSQLTVEFTVDTPQLVTLSVRELSSDISDPTPTVFTNGALLALGDELTNLGVYTVFLLDNGGDFGQLEPPLDAFDTDDALLGIVDSFVLSPGDYSFGAQTVVTASEGTLGTGVSVADFQITFAPIPEPTTVALTLLGLAAVCSDRRRR